MPLPLALAAALGLGAAKMGVDAYRGVRQDRYNRRLRDAQKENEEAQKHDARRGSMLRALGVHAPLIQHQLRDMPDAPDMGGANTLSGLLGFGSNAASLYGAQDPAEAGPTDVPMPYQGQSFPSPYGPHSRIKPGTPYR